MKLIIFLPLQINIGELIQQIKVYLSNPSEYRQQLAILMLAFVFAILIIVFLYVGTISIFERIRVKRAIKKRARRKLTPFERAVRTGITILVLTVIIAGYYYTHYDEKFCASCHNIEPYVKEHKRSKDHLSVKCISCHSNPGLTGKLSNLPRELRNLFVYLSLAKPTKSSPLFESSCYSCHKEIKSKTVGTVARVRHLDFLSPDNANISCSQCHKGLGHNPQEVSSKYICSQCHNGKQAFAMKECSMCHKDDVTLTQASSDETLIRKIGTGPLRCYNVCHPKQVESKCTPCHGTVMPHPAEFIKRHAANSWENRALCVRCHQERGATTKRACGCHPEEGTSMHGTFEYWFIEHQKAARSNPYMNCLCHESGGPKDLCDFCHIEGSPLRKAMLQQLTLQQQAPIAPGP